MPCARRRPWRCARRVAPWRCDRPGIRTRKFLSPVRLQKDKLSLAQLARGAKAPLARGARRIQQRRAIALAIGPIWEANHVWLILAIVVTFVAFPTAFAAISTALHIPLVLLLIGIVLRGSAFVFRAYDSRRPEVQDRYSIVFEAGSLLSPIMLGIVVGMVKVALIMLAPIAMALERMLTPE